MFKEKRYKFFLDKYFFLLKDDFFEFPYLSNSPQLMVKGMLEIPIFKHKQTTQCLSTNNAFCKADFRYRKLEEGLWLLESVMHFKQNVHSKATFSEDEASEYYFLSFSVFSNKFAAKNYESNAVRLVNEYWTLQKPNTEMSTYFYSGSVGRIYKICFTKQWVKQNLFVLEEHGSSRITNFLDTKAAFYTWLNSMPRTRRTVKKIEAIFGGETVDEQHIAKLKQYTLDLIAEFFLLSAKDFRFQQNIALNNSDYYNVAKAENIIQRNLSGTFPGIKNIAARLNVSPTKLKRDFKAVYGYSMLQYHKEKNMLHALQLIKKSDLLIQTIAAATGFESASKFTAAFSKRFGRRPSAFR
jgi:AraC-like DNA-binding protein